MLELKLNHVSKGIHWRYSYDNIKVPSIYDYICIMYMYKPDTRRFT